MKETKKCPNCNFEGSMECWKTIGSDEITLNVLIVNLHLETMRGKG
ncbi:MAG: hypothetical protein WCF28_11905 [Methanobacterium sp.]